MNIERAHSNRLTFLIILFAIFWVALVAKYGWIQIVQSPLFQDLAKRQYESQIELEARRGMIYDRNGNKLATNLFSYSYAADPKYVKDPGKIARKFADVFGKGESWYASRLQNKNRFVWLERRADERLASSIREEKFSGIIEMKSLRRYYPYGKIAAQIIGFTDVDNRGADGIENEYDHLLAGKNGFAIYQKDGTGAKNPNIENPIEEPVDGGSLKLTIDLVYQSIAEEELSKTVQQTEAVGGTVVMMNPKTGEILAMASLPSYDPNFPSQSDMGARKKHPITDLFEPGSSFKIVTAAAALNEKLKNPSDLIFCENGSYKVYDVIVHDHEKYGYLTFQQTFENSSNIGMIKVAKDIGKERFYRYARAFGFGEATGVNIAGEAKGLLKEPKDWSGMTLPSMAFGQEVGVTALQLTSAYCAVANDGILMKPRLVVEVYDQKGKSIESYSPEVIRRVVLPQTSQTLRSFLEGVVVRGTAKKAYIEGWRIAGKTGTAQKMDEKGQTYSQSKYIASFVGMFPADNPQIVGLVTLDEPKRIHWGGELSAPVFRNIVERIFGSPNMIEMRSQDQFTGKVVKEKKRNRWTVPDVRNMRVDVAEQFMESRKLKTRVLGQGDIVMDQEPKPGEYSSLPDEVKIVLARSEKNVHGERYIPNVVGLTIREAINKLAVENLDVKVIGSGMVTKQTPPARFRVQAGQKILLECNVY